MNETQKETLKIIALDSWVELPAFDIEHDLTVITDGSASTRPEQLKEADIIINSQVPIDQRLLGYMPKLRLIASTGTGTDHIDKKAVAERGVTLCNVPAQNTDAVAEHAFALASALKRRILPMHQMTVEGRQWAEKRAGHLAFGLPPRTNGEETLVSAGDNIANSSVKANVKYCIVGYGALGRKIEQIGTALGMKIKIVERKNASSVRPGRISFSDALRQGTLFITVVPRNAETHNMFGAPELEAMDPTAVLVNVGRGGVVNEEAVAKGLRNGQIGGFATDVFAVEPATRETSVLLDETIPNLILSPHIAWYSSRTLQGTRDVLKGNVEGFVSGKTKNVVV